MVKFDYIRLSPLRNEVLLKNESLTVFCSLFTIIVYDKAFFKLL